MGTIDHFRTQTANTTDLPEIEAFSVVDKVMAVTKQVEPKPVFDGLSKEILTEMITSEAEADTKTKTAIVATVPSLTESGS